eukprot:jgi/Orpsp1_1/1179804/evm.model.c7180000070803.1
MSNYNAINTHINFENVLFNNIEAYEFGGIIYSSNEYANDIVLFKDCKFENIKAKFGIICHSFDNECVPNISNREELMKTIGSSSFSTNPIRLDPDINNLNNITIFSGDFISETLKFVFIESDPSSMELDNLIIFKIGTNDLKNIKLLGQTNGYCWDNSCDISNLKIVGNPGTYLLYIELITYGNYNSFNNSKSYLEITISDCPRSYIKQDKYNVNIDSCYKPVCTSSCNSGICVNDDVCDCTNTNYKGKSCDEHYILERYKIVDRIIFISTLILVALIAIIIILIFVYKNDNIIKAALTYKRSNFSCIIIFLSYNIGFTLIYSSILVKTYRVYKIFKTKKVNRNVNINMMYLMIFVFTLYHILSFLFWYYFDEINTELNYDKNEKEYVVCKLPEFKII